MTTSSGPEKPEKAPSVAQLRTAALVAATDALSNRVGVLADAVQINNARIETFQEELNKKPDDVELKVASGMASVERGRHLKYAVATGVLAAIVSSLISFYFAHREIDERTRQANIACERGNLRATLDAQVYDDVRTIVKDGPVADTLEQAANRLRETLADCDGLHPISKG